MNKELEDLIDDWHWDEESKVFATDLGIFLLAFCEYLKTQDLSVRNLRNHLSNVQLIGMFACQYCYDDEFDAEMFESGEASYEYEFGYKVSDSPTALSSYRSTWKRISKFMQSENYETFYKI
ncbi:MAG: hypothetical protein U5M51_02320 [Emticicia sp.]|nr:hypothetical protein [Emticicia sp.]